MDAEDADEIVRGGQGRSAMDLWMCAQTMLEVGAAVCLLATGYCLCLFTHGWMLR